MRICSLFTLALLAAAITQPAQAGIIVDTASGNIGQFSATNTGVDGGGTATLVFNVPSAMAVISTVNGAFITPEIASVNTPVTMLVTPVGSNNYSLALVPTTYQETVGVTPNTAIMNFTLSKGTVTSNLTNFFNASGDITGLVQNLNPNLDFSRFGVGPATINFTLTATTFGGGASTFAEFIATAGATAVGNGSFSQAVVAPEPATVAGALSGGLCLLAYGAWRRKSRVTTGSCLAIAA